MKKRQLIFFCFSLGSTLVSFSQKTFFSLGPEISFPKSHGMEMVSASQWGGSFRLETSISDHVSGIASVGFLASTEQQYEPSSITRLNQQIPILAGIKYYLRQRNKTPMGFYLSGELGLIKSYFLFRYDLPAEYQSRQTDLGLALGLGFLMRKLDFGFRFQYDPPDAGFNVNQFNFRLGYVFRKK